MRLFSVHPRYIIVESMLSVVLRTSWAGPFGRVFCGEGVGVAVVPVDHKMKRSQAR